MFWFVASTIRWLQMSHWAVYSLWSNAQVQQEAGISAPMLLNNEDAVPVRLITLGELPSTHGGVGFS